MPATGVMVAIRVRPFNSREKEMHKDQAVISMQGTQTILQPPSGDSKASA